MNHVANIDIQTQVHELPHIENNGSRMTKR